MQYKAHLIMNKLLKRFQLSELKSSAAKIIKIQINCMSKEWRKANERTVSIPFKYCRLSYHDEWLMLEDSPADIAI